MPSRFAALENRVSDTCDAVFGERFEYLPFTSGPGGGRGAPDGGRSSYAFTAIFDDKTFASRAMGEVERTASQITMRHVWLAVDARNLQGVPRRLDRVRRVDTGVIYDIAAINEDSEHRYKLRLTELTGAP